MTSHTREYVPFAAHAPAKSTCVGSNSYEVFWRRVPIILFPNCLSILFCSFYEWPWLALTFAVCPALVLLAVLVAECLAFDRRCDTPPENEYPYIDTKEQL